MAASAAEPLHAAIRTGDTEAVDALLRQGADCNTLVLGCTALHCAVHWRRFGLVRRLLDHGADPAAKATTSHDTPLLLASRADNGAVTSDPARVQAVRDMLEAVSADVRCLAARTANTAGSTPLQWIVRRLADVQTGLFSGDSFEKELELAKLLVRCGADLDATDVFGRSPSSVLKGLSRKITLEEIAAP